MLTRLQQLHLASLIAMRAELQAQADGLQARADAATNALASAEPTPANTPATILGAAADSLAERTRVLSRLDILAAAIAVAQAA